MREITINTPSGLMQLHACGVCETRRWNLAGVPIERSRVLELAATVTVRAARRAAA